MILHTTARCITDPPCEWVGTTDKSAERHVRETGHATIVETIPMRAPRRIQMSRKHPWRADNPDAVIVARPSRWGNPERALDRSLSEREAAYWWFERHLRKRREPGSPAAFIAQYVQYPSDAEIRTALRGHDLCCWCPLPEPGQPDICHGAVLLEIANAPENEAS